MKFAFALVSLSLGVSFSPLPAQQVSHSGDEPVSAASALPSLSPPTYGRIDGDYYVSPTGLYRVKIPVLAQLGGTITDTRNVATFDDDFTIHINIAAFPITRELKADFETRDTKSFLINFFTSIVMTDFVSNFPGSKMEESAVFLSKFEDGAMMIFSLHPGGSNFEQRSIISRNIPPVVAKRGNLCFVRSGHVFVVSIELAERALERSTYKKTPAEENAILHQRLMDLMAKMQFSEPRAEAKN
jgi:hypothetical protein